MLMLNLALEKPKARVVFFLACLSVKVKMESRVFFCRYSEHQVCDMIKQESTESRLCLLWSQI